MKTIMCFQHLPPWTKVIAYLLKTILKERQSPLADPLCNMLPLPFTAKGSIGPEYVIFSSPVLSTALLGYISSYLIFPMYINNDVNNPLLISFVQLEKSSIMRETFEILMLLTSGIIPTR